MVRFRPCRLAREERDVVLQVRGHRQRALAHIDANDALMRRWRGVCDLHLQTYQQVELLVGLVVPQLRRADARAVLEEFHMPRVASVRQDNTPLQR